MYALGGSNKTKRLIASFEAVCEANGRKRVNGATASERTFRMQVEIMKQFARTLHGAGYMVEDTGNLGEKHINAVFDAWVEKGLSAKTLQNQRRRILLGQGIDAPRDGRLRPYDLGGDRNGGGEDG